MNIDLKFRKLSPADIGARTETLNERDVLDGILIEAPVSRDESERWFERIQSVSSRRDFVLVSNGVPVGFSGIVNVDYRDRNGEIYIFISSKFHKKGFGAKLLQMTLEFSKYELNLRKIILYVTESNKNAMQFYEKNGFEKEAILRDHTWHRGNYHNRIIYSLFMDTFNPKEKIMYKYIS